MKTSFLRICLSVLCCLGYTLANADTQAEIKDKLTAMGIPYISIKPAGFLDFYEVYSGSEIFYVDKHVQHLVLGNVIDLTTQRNLTSTRMDALSAVPFASLNLKNAIKNVKGKGERILVTVEDPNCGYCKRLAKELDSMDNVTIYTFLFPILNADSLEKSNNIWCSANRVEAWENWILRNQSPEQRAGDCQTPALQNVEFFKQKNVKGTPTIFFVNGSRIPGFAPKARIESKLAELKS